MTQQLIDQMNDLLQQLIERASAEERERLVGDLLQRASKPVSSTTTRQRHNAVNPEDVIATMKTLDGAVVTSTLLCDKLGTDKIRLTRALHTLIEAGQIKKIGDKRATTYQLAIPAPPSEPEHEITEPQKIIGQMKAPEVPPRQKIFRRRKPK